MQDFLPEPAQSPPEPAQSPPEPAHYPPEPVGSCRQDNPLGLT